ncbi:DUF1287 domain-containing protein [Zooshikella marina]|uniref:DUF1287 domain-containing protein n=1 Tax=Zooshikella ganghwensis TaxID=202772 RepID=UPI001BAF7E2A|nr:DUF1287 domain-containing protein [Zooshikella ganghwensis]MBU2708419.1 DUF1287 domain-containing protein [Zooshikella ganghwensis]
MRKIKKYLLLTNIVTVFTLSFCQTTIANQAQKLVDAAIERTNQKVTYDGRYVKIPYPNGDVPNNIGVCTDVVIRSYRKLGIDLQKLVHEDMKRAFDVYPKLWGLTKTDTNIDHRRVPNLQTFFKRHGTVLPVTDNASDYRPGDIVTWLLPGNLTHIGIIIDKKNIFRNRPLVVHNIGHGTVAEDMLFDYKITGHYRYKLENK